MFHVNPWTQICALKYAIDHGLPSRIFFFFTQKPPIVTGISVRNLGSCASSRSMLEGWPVGCYMGLGQATMVAVHL